MIAPWVAWCVAVLWLIRSNPPKKSGLALAVAVSSIPLLLSIPISVAGILSGQIFLQFEDLLTPSMGYLGLFEIAQVGMVVSAIKTYYGLKREPDDIRKLVEGFVISVIILTLTALLMPRLDRHRPASPEASAAASLRTIATANVTYSSTYNVGYAGTLASMGPSTAPTSAAADLLDSVLSGVSQGTPSPVKSGYRFTYVAPNPAPTPDQPNATFSVVATPVSPGKSGTSTFCVDHTNVVGRDTSGKATSAPATGCPYEAFLPM